MKHLRGYGLALMILVFCSLILKKTSNNLEATLLFHVVIATLITAIWLMAEGESRSEAKKPEQESNRTILPDRKLQKKVAEGKGVQGLN
ncbi:hypothetical protein HYT92_01565 [Candidatus Pacearchaeota archaeon]|nr:hypothetical protein [Candidatus Pacearchaeota archaeon]